MKSFFTKLGTLLLCGVAVAVVGCTDFSEDIQASKSELENSIADLSSKTDVKVKDLQDAINALSAQLAADYATKQELANVQTTLTNEIQTQVNDLNSKVSKVGNDLNAAVTTVNASIAALEQADATNKAALEAAIAAAKAEATTAITQLQAALEAQKTGFEAEIANVKKQIADTKAELEAVVAEKAGKEYVDEELGKVNAKADELFNTIQSLSEYLGTLEAQISELNNTLISLSQYLPTVEVKIAENTAKVTELKNELVSLSAYLSEREALVNAQLKELQNTLLSLGVYMESLEASIDARFAEILNTIESLSIHLVEVEAQVALNTESAAAANAKAEELYNTLLSLSYEYNEEKAANAAKFAEVLATFESLSQHLAQKEAEHEAGIADNSAKIAELKSELVSLSQYLEEANYDGKFVEIQNTLLALSDHLAAEEAANLAKFAEILSTFESLSQHLAQTEEDFAAGINGNAAKIAELFNTIQSLSPVIDNLDAKILEVKNTVESLGTTVMDSLAVHNAKIYELQGTLVSLSMFLEEANLIVRVSALEDDLAAHLAAYEVFQTATVEDLANLFARTEQLFGQLEALSPEVTTIKAQIAEIKSELLSLSEYLGEREADVDGKLAELFATFESLSPVIATMQAQILENNSALQSLAPVIATMQAQIAENFATLQSLSPKIEELEEKDAELDTKIAEVRNQLVSLEPVISTMQSQINENRGTLESLSEYLPELKAELEDKISAVDAKANELNGQLTALAEQLPVMFAEVNASIKAVADRVTKIEVDIEGLKAAIAGLQEAKTAMEGAIDELQAQDSQLANSIISYYEQAIAAVDDAVADLQAKIDANAEDIEANAEAVANAMIKIGEVETALETAIDELTAQDAQLAGSILSYYEQAIAATEDVANNLETAIGRIDELEDALEALKNLGMEKLEALQNADAALAAKIEEKTTNVMNMLLTVVVAAEDRANDKIAQLRTLVNDAHSFIEELRGEISDLAKRVQSLVYVPEYSDGKANVHYGATINVNANVLNLTDVAFVPAKTTLRYKVNSTSATIVDEIVEAYKANPAILSYDVEGVKVRGASANGATLEVVGVSKDKDGYLAVDVLAKNFDKAFFLSAIKATGNQNNSILGGIWDALFGDNATSALDKLIALSEKVGEHKGYSAALVLADANTVNNVASEFTNLIADKNYDLLQLGARYQAAGKDVVLTALQSIPALKYPYANADHIIASSDTETAVMTTASEPVVQISKGGNLETYTPEALYEKYGYKVEIQKHRHVVSYAKGGKLDATGANADWAADVNAYNTDKFIVNDADAIGTSRSVKLVAYDEANKVKYDERVGSYIDVVDVYYLNGQSVAVADKVTITKNLVYINFTPQTYNWTLQKAINLRAEDKTPYGNDLVFYDVTYDNIYGLQPILESGNVLAESLKLNGTDDATEVKVSAIEKPVAGKAGSATVAFAKGYKFNAETANEYVKTWRVDLNETTEAVITFKATLSQLPAAVEVKSNVDLDLVAGQTYFDGNDALIADAYAAFGAANAGFATDAKANDLMFAALTDAKNTMDNGPEPASLYNLNFNVTNNEDKTFVRLYKEQFEGSVPPATYTFTRDITTWFGVPFNFVVTATPKLPAIGLVRSTEYASATAEPKVYSVNLQARVDNVDKVYTVVQSDLAYYLNVIGDVNDTQKVTYEVLDDAVSTIANSSVAVQPLETPIPNPLLGKEITAYLQKDQAQLTWKDKGTQIKVKATLWASVYPIDEATLILNVEDPISFSAASIDVPRIVEDDTPVNVWKNFSLSSTAKKFDGTVAHPGDLINREATSIKDIISAEVKKAYGIEVGVELVTIYEQTEAGNVLYDGSKYDDTKLESDGILVLKRDDAAVLLNPIVAQIRVTFKHNVHGVGDKCSETTDIFVKFYQN